MTPNTLRHMQLLRGGEIRAWALTGTSFERIVAEAGDGLPVIWSSDCRLFGIPVVIVRPGEPEGAIV